MTTSISTSPERPSPKAVERAPSRRRRCSGIVSGTAMVAMVAAACSSTPARGAGSTTTAGAGRSASTSLPVETVGAAEVPLVGMVLVDGQGMTLYRDSQEAGGHVVCTAACAQVWPPFTVPSGATVKAGAGVNGNVSTVSRPDGTQQVTFDGWPLYRYSGDHGPGQAAGNDVGGIWFALAAAGASAATPSGPAPAPGSAGGASGTSAPAGTGRSSGQAPSPIPVVTAPAPTSPPPTNPPTTSPPPTSPPTTNAPTTTPPSPTTTYSYGYGY